MFTGFGLFQSPPRNSEGVPYNVSGSVARYMADSRYFPDQISTTSIQSITRQELKFAKHSHMPENSGGATVKQREMIIDNRPVTVCFILLDVIWDQAAAIILYEANQFYLSDILGN